MGRIEADIALNNSCSDFGPVWDRGNLPGVCLGNYSFNGYLGRVNV